MYLEKREELFVLLVGTWSALQSCGVYTCTHAKAHVCASIIVACSRLTLACVFPVKPDALTIISTKHPRDVLLEFLKLKHIHLQQATKTTKLRGLELQAYPSHCRQSPRRGLRKGLVGKVGVGWARARPPPLPL
uniref:Uncharacterized protein n=1 Tax=Oryza punctata TaxID=4537 RepID=A0A0E0KMR1_ORYPU